jgi:hypothetical protein
MVLIDGRANTGHTRRRCCALFHHLFEGTFDDTCAESTPSSVDDAKYTRRSVVTDDWKTVCRHNGENDIGRVRHQCITARCLALLEGTRPSKRFVNEEGFGAVEGACDDEL